MRVALGVHGRFFAFNIATALIELGQDIRLFTNYPAFVAQRFGVPVNITSGFVAHGAATRLAGRLPARLQTEAVEVRLHRSFGSWLARRLKAEPFGVAYCWSGVAEEAFASFEGRKVLNRSSVHIQTQYDLLAKESHRAGRKIEVPSRWRIAREAREYALADRIIVPSAFAAASFENTPAAGRVTIVPLTASADIWRPDARVVEERIGRIHAGERLRILYVGAISYRKGMYDLAAVVRNLSRTMDFRFTGTITPECRDLVANIEAKAQFDGHVREIRLRESYAWADVLVCPSIEDGFAVVLSHAQAAGIPFIASTNTGGPELLASGGQGWIVPIRTPEAIERQLQWCNMNREEVADMVRQLYAQPVQRTWLDVARDVVHCCLTERPDTA